MRYLIKKARIVSPEKTSQRKDILIERGKILKIGRNIADDKATVINSKNLYVSIGFCDIGTFIGEPGLEERETIESVANAASNGGYTQLAPFPNLDPVVDSKSTLKFIRREFEDTIISVHPIGAISKKCGGKDIAEMIDMHQHGAIAFSDGKKSIQDTGLVLRALQYSKTIKTTIIQQPNDKALSKDTFMHEGAVSTSLGLPGNPVEAEVLMVKRDIDLSRYAEAPICIHNISSKRSVELIKKAKKKDVSVYSSVSAMNLLHTHEALENFEPVYKVFPPLREEDDQKALLKAVRNDTIDYISSNHVPVELEHKDLEFFRSAFGASTIDTVFSSLLTFVSETISLNKLIDKLAYGPRKALGLDEPKIKEGEIADLCIFDPDIKWTVDASNIYSKSKNNPYIGRELTGKVLAVFNNKKVIVQPT